MLNLRLTRAQAFHLLLMIIALPTQILLSTYTGNNREELRQQTITNLIDTVKSLRLYDGKTLLKSLMNYLDIPMSKINQNQDLQESVAIDVLKHRSPEGYFVVSTVVRIPRPDHVKFRMGQMVRHRRLGYRAVVAGWDEVCKAPKDWKEKFHGPDNKKWENQPNYLVLIDQRDRTDMRMAYVVEDDMEALSLRKARAGIKNKRLDNYFDYFDGVRYQMRPAMKILYPED